MEALRHLTTSDGPKVLVVTTFDNNEHAYRALHGNACGFLLKDSGTTLLVKAIRAAASGKALVSPSITLKLLRAYTAPTTPRPPHTDLSTRELDVVRLVATGLTTAEIAARLYLSVGTVKTHLGSVQSTLPTRNRVEMAAWAWQSGLTGG